MQENCKYGRSRTMLWHSNSFQRTIFARSFHKSISLYRINAKRLRFLGLHDHHRQHIHFHVDITALGRVTFVIFNFSPYGITKVGFAHWLCTVGGLGNFNRLKCMHDILYFFLWWCVCNCIALFLSWWVILEIIIIVIIWNAAPHYFILFLYKGKRGFKHGTGHRWNKHGPCLLSFSFGQTTNYTMMSFCVFWLIEWDRKHVGNELGLICMKSIELKRTFWLIVLLI